MSKYLNNALDGYARPAEERRCVRAGAFVLSLEQFRHRSRWEPDLDGQWTEGLWNDYTYHCTVRCLVYDAFAFLAASRPDYGNPRKGERAYFNKLEELAHEILARADGGDEKAVLDAADDMAALTPYWAKEPYCRTEEKSGH
ncbi:hypothetical protein [Streptomyces mirabilis]|uniref:hypothetical protein n=1 Tax=Streptomyces mirabilis TaxID=68239 RepID=UPI0033BD0CE5